MRAIILITFCLMAPLVSAQPTPQSMRVLQILPGLQSSEWRVRETAFDELVNLAFGESEHRQVSQYSQVIPKFLKTIPVQAEEVRMYLIELLNKEDAVVHNADQTKSRLSEEYVNYYGNVIASVSALKDPRAISALVGAMTTGGMAQRALAEFGEKALIPVLEQSSDEDPTVRSSSLFALADMLQTGLIKNPTETSRVKTRLASALRDRDPGVRSSAVWAIGSLNDTEFVSELSRIATSDPATLPGQADEGGEFYPVRHAATEVLKKFKQH